MVLSLIEAGLAPKLEVHEPVAALQAVSHDTSLTATLRLLDGRRITALDLQWIYYEAAAKHAQDTGVADAVDGDGHTHQVLERWSATLTELGSDRAAAASSVEWLAKLSLLEGYRDRDGLDWGHARLGLVDLQWADIRPEKGLYYRMLARDRMQRLVDDTRIQRAVTEPPSDTRAFFRGRCISRFGADVVGAELGLRDLRCARPRQAATGPRPGSRCAEPGTHRRALRRPPGGRTVPLRAAGLPPGS